MYFKNMSNVRHILLWILLVLSFYNTAGLGDDTVCQSIDIRNNVEQFNNLRGCRVVEGFVEIMLFDSFNESISFPELREITEYLMVYRVKGLRSLGQLFPNLAVIRGQQTFFDYAFIVYEMPSLQDIGLYSLTDITNGLIRIERNPSLCFVNSIDWDLIAHEKGDHVIKSIKSDNECPRCPEDVSKEESACPQVIRNMSFDDVSQGKFLCWNRQHCQKVCPNNCNNTCDDYGVCCDRKCLGGCKEGTCNVCRNFTVTERNVVKCGNNCPEGMFEYLGRRCLTKDECLHTTQLIFDEAENLWKKNVCKIFNSTCVLKCPVNYMEDVRIHECVPS